MKEPTVVRLGETERVSFGPLSHYQPIIGDDDARPHRNPDGAAGL